MNRYGIKDGYTARTEHTFFDDTPFSDQFQNPVYEHALAVTQRYGLHKIVDVGCGSGYKLMKYFSTYDTTGVDLSPTVEWLKGRYPTRRWVDSSHLIPHGQVVICSDVIEHLVNPDELLNYIEAVRPEVIILSTPERDLLQPGTENGPPRNVHHVREWNRSELKSYLSGRWNVSHQLIVDEATQIAECYPRR